MAAIDTTITGPGVTSAITLTDAGDYALRAAGLSGSKGFVRVEFAPATSGDTFVAYDNAGEDGRLVKDGVVRLTLPAEAVRIRAVDIDTDTTVEVSLSALS